jgi:DNA ligase (NAD+)
VIPEVVGVVPKDGPRGEPFDLYKQLKGQCPICGAAIVREEGEIDWRCSGGISCPAQRKQALLHFASRQALNIEGFGEEIIEQLVDLRVLDDVASFFDLTAERLEGLELRREPFAYKSGETKDKVVRIQRGLASKLVSSVQIAKQRPLAKVIFGLGIRHVGATTAVDLARFFGTLRDFSEAPALVLRLVKDVGETTAKAIQVFFAQEHNRVVVSRLIEKLETPSEPHRTRVKFEDLLTLLGVKGIGQKSIHAVAHRWATPDALLEAGDAGQLDQSEADLKLAQALQAEPWEAALKALRGFGVAVGEALEPNDTALGGKTVVITGKLVELTREEAEARAREAGARVAGSVSTKTDMLVAGPGAGGKLAEANRLGIRVVDEKEFLALLAGGAGRE